jgi:hypothetical protein
MPFPMAIRLIREHKHWLIFYEASAIRCIYPFTMTHIASLNASLTVTISPVDPKGVNVASHC